MSEDVLAKFGNCSDYYEWTEKEKLCHLRASLEGPAGQVLWDVGQQSSVDVVVRLLKNRFGSLNEEELYRSELKARRLRRGEPLQSVYQDVRRLMALAFPGQCESMWEVMARDAFVESLSDPSLRIRVLERDPTTLEVALKIVSRLEAIGADDLEESWNDLRRRKEKFIKTSATVDDSERQELVSVVEELKSEVEHHRSKLERLRSGEARSSSSSSRDEYYLGGTIALLLQDHRTMSTTGSL